MALTGALCYGELAARRPEADGGYVGSLLALLMALPRVYYAMARDGLFFKGAAVLHPRFGTPARAIGIQAAIASVLVLLGTFKQIVAYFIFITVLFVGLTVGALFVLRRGRDRSPPIGRRAIR